MQVCVILFQTAWKLQSLLFCTKIATKLKFRSLIQSIVKVSSTVACSYYFGTNFSLFCKLIKMSCRDPFFMHRLKNDQRSTNCISQTTKYPTCIIFMSAYLGYKYYWLHGELVLYNTSSWLKLTWNQSRCVIIVVYTSNFRIAGKFPHT